MAGLGVVWTIRETRRGRSGRVGVDWKRTSGCVRLAAWDEVGGQMRDR